MEKLIVAVIIALAVIILTRQIRNAIQKPINGQCGGNCNECQLYKEMQTTIQKGEEHQGD